MLVDGIEIVFDGITGAFELFTDLSNYYDLLWVLIGFFTAFTVYRFVIRPLAGGGFVDPTAVLRVFKGADSDEARKPEKK